MTYPNPSGNPDPSAPPPYQPPQGYPPQPGYGQPYPPQTGYPQQPGYPSQPGYPPPGYPYQPGYPQQQQMYAQPRPAVAARNQFAQSALVMGGLSLGANIVGIFLHFFLTGILGVYALYLGIRGIVVAARLPGNKGLWMAIGGTILAILSLLITLLGYMSR